MNERTDASRRFDRTIINDCWNRIGVRGDRSCPELTVYVHCRNCPVYSAGAAELLEGDPPADYLARWTRHFAQPAPTEDIETRSIVIFRIGSEWLALPASVVVEVANVLPVHSLPHRQGGAVIGLVNVRGELLICVSLGQVVGVEPAASASRERRGTSYQRLLVIRREDVRVVCPVDEVHGIHHVHPRDLKSVPTTVAKATVRPFADGVEGLPRMVRDLAHSLQREVKLEIVGGATQVDRDILARLDAPLGHLLRNAVDHGIEPPHVRRAAGKPAEGLVRVEARHSAGALQIIVSDDGCGVDLEKLREAVVARNLTTREASRALSDAELLEFLFLPGFTMKPTVTDVSGRGVGLDVVQDMVKQVRGTVRVSSDLGKGTRFQLQLPVTLSVVRTLLAEIAGEPYAFPLAYIVRALKLSTGKIARLEGRQHFEFDGRQIGLVTARQVLAADAPAALGDELPVIVIGDQHHTYGLVVDRFLGERELVVQPLDAQLGKIKDIAAGALMEDGAPVLIVDADDLIRSLDRLVSVGRLDSIPRGSDASPKGRKRVLVVDDSLTVRELERKLIGNGGYDVDVAVDGMDGWNALRTGHFDLVVTDIDMPRMDGIELVTLINKDVNLKSVPVIIVSYKDRDEDRQRGLEAGAAYYLTKGSFHDETLLHAVIDLIGGPSA